MVTVNRESGQVTFNGEYYVMRHFSQFVKPGAKRVLTTGGWNDKIAFVNPDGSTVLVIGNSSGKPMPIVITIANRPGDDTWDVTVAPHSVNTFIVAAQ